MCTVWCVLYICTDKRETFDKGDQTLIYPLGKTWEVEQPGWKYSQRQWQEKKEVERCCLHKVSVICVSNFSDTLVLKFFFFFFCVWKKASIHISPYYKQGKLDVVHHLWNFVFLYCGIVASVNHHSSFEALSLSWFWPLLNENQEICQSSF